MLVTLLLVQAVAGPQLPPAPRPRSDAPCPPIVDPTEIVVCGRAADRFRLRQLPAEAERLGLPRARLRLGDAALAVEAEQATLSGDVQSQRLMVRLKLPFGAKRAH